MISKLFKQSFACFSVHFEKQLIINVTLSSNDKQFFGKEGGAEFAIKCNDFASENNLFGTTSGRMLCNTSCL